MKICLIGKYPPIEGGESSKLYWLARGLGEKGVKVHIITNAWEVEEKYREEITGDDLIYYQPKNVKVYNTDPFLNPHFIPHFSHYTEKIANKAIEAIKDFELQIIDSWYILPYGIAGFLVKQITGLPLIVRHAGSDITRLLHSPSLNVLFVEILKRADKIVTYPSSIGLFRKLGIPEEKLFFNRVSVNLNEFNPEGPIFDLSSYLDKDLNKFPIISYFGKIDATKGVYELIEAVSELKEDFWVLFVTQNEELVDFRRFVKEKKMEEKVIFLGFFPPWKIPSLIRTSYCVIMPEIGFPVIHHTPILAREVFGCGKCLILSTELYRKFEKMGFRNGENCLAIDPKNTTIFRETIKNLLRNPQITREIGKNARATAEKIESYDNYIDNIIELYQEFLIIS